MRRLYTYGVFLALACGSCSERVVAPGLDPAPAEVTFRTFIREGDQVRPTAASKALVGNLSAGFMLGGAWSTTPFTTTAAANKTNFVAERPMKGDGTDANASKIFWKADGTTYHGFYAYSTNPVGTATGFGVYNVKTGVGQAHAALGFKQPDAPNQQIDLLVAESLDHKVGLGAPSLVNLYFEHRFARVRVRIYGNGTVAINKCQGSIAYSSTNAPANDFVQHDYVKYSGKYNSLAPKASKHSGTHPIGTQFQITQANINAGTAATVGDMILQTPQTLTEGWVVFNITYTVEGSAVAKTASVGLPALSLEPSKQYDVSVFLSEYNKLLAVSGVSVGEWVTESDVIDHFVSPTLTLSAAAPTDNPVPKAGKSYNVLVTTNAAWTASELTNVTLDRIAGGIGTTTVKVTVPASTAAARAVSVKFTTDAVGGGSASTKTWAGTQESFLETFSQALPGFPGTYVAKSDFREVSGVTANAECEAVGFRQPTKDELLAIYDNRSIYGPFALAYYWSSTRDVGAPEEDNMFYIVFMVSGGAGAEGSTRTNNGRYEANVRCVKDGI